MTNVMAINGFELVSQDEMMAVDGGGWIRAVCVAAGGIIGVVAVVNIPIADPIIATGVIIACAVCGDTVGKMIEDAYAA